MPLNERKIIAIILEECGELPERCPGYKSELIDRLSNVVRAERQHAVQGTNIQQKVSDQCNAAGRFLASGRGDLSGGEV